MQALSNVLQPYKGLIGQVASVVTIGQFFSGAFVCKDIYKKGSTGEIAATPFIGGVVIGALMLKHGLLLDDPAMLQVNVAAIALNAIYTIFYYFYSRDKYNDVLKPVGIGAVIVATILGYAELENPEDITYRYGILITILMLLLLGMPLLGVRDIIEKKDASSIPFPLTFMATVTTFLWLIYGIVLMNEFMIIQNVIGFLLTVTQLILIVTYPGPGSEGPKVKKSAKED